MLTQYGLQYLANVAHELALFVFVELCQHLVREPDALGVVPVLAGAVTANHSLLQGVFEAEGVLCLRALAVQHLSSPKLCLE